MKKPQHTDEYIASFPPDTQLILEKLRSIIKSAAPKAEEIISYGMPAYKQHSVLVYFAGYKNHIGFYPTPSAIRTFNDEISKKYNWSKGAVQFPVDKPLPAALIKKIVHYRLKEDMEKHIAGTKKT